MTAYIRRYLLVHGAYLVVVLSLLAWYGLTPGQALARFDGQHYLQIASTGYVDKLTFLTDGKPARMNIAFFPLYPLLMAALHAVTRLPMEIAGLVLSLAASLATAIGLGVLLEPLFGRRTALWTVTIWAVGVDAIVQSMLYAQPLIAAFAVWGAIAIRRRKPLLGAVCAIGAGLSHSTGLGLIVVVMAGSALMIREAARKKQWRATFAPAAAFVLAPMGLVGYIAFLAVRFHRLDAWFLAESAPGWSSEFDFGKYSARTVFGQLDSTDWFAPNGVPHLVASLWILPGVGIMLWLLRDQGWWPKRLRRFRRTSSVAVAGASASQSRSPSSSGASQSPSPSSASQSLSPLAASQSQSQSSSSASQSPSPSAASASVSLSSLAASQSQPPSSSSSSSQSRSPSPSAAPSFSSPLEAPRPRVPWELTLFSLVTFAVILTNSGPWGSKPRFLIPALGLCVPPAIWLGRLDHRPRVQRAIVLGIALVSVLCCAYLDGPSPSAL
ncbi:hypothetical protein [Actinospica sp.]|uniref:hypothetical protein n=1 Tax=Actinospica sp. TaxID=1872142 RepID=UPI002C5AE2F3|nr:hypothetical protein [Actinospica sp.]HWG22631.1 hypothetical protein [Actinospica sp.]